MTHDSKELVFNEQGREGVRLDVFLADEGIGFSRSRLQCLIKEGHIRVNDQEIKPSRPLHPGDRILIDPPAPVSLLEAEAVEFGILYEDRAIIVVDKPTGLVVHPAPGNQHGTLVHGLLYHCDDLSGMGGVLRPGIVHRLDKQTSGVLVVAKNDRVHENLSRQFASGTVEKTYLALVHGVPPEKRGRVDCAIGRHPVKRKQMFVLPPSKGRRAITLWKRKKVYGQDFAEIELQLKTGRTHQIRVHMAHIGFPVVGDSVYGRGMSRWNGHALRTAGILPGLSRHLLHAFQLIFTHPENGMRMTFISRLPEDFSSVLKVLDSVYSTRN
ncbi:MAG: RluA family pseudouridine synthase [Desulfatiglandaceae bacterium]